MIKFKEKLYFAPIAAMGGLGSVALVGGTTGLSMIQSSAQASDQERQAEESQRLQRRMNKELQRIADSGDPVKGQQAASVLQGQQSFSNLSDDLGEDLGNGVKKAGNIVGGAAGTVTGGAVGSVLGAAGGALAAKGINKVAGTKIGAGKAGLIGTGVGLIGGSILGGQKGSSLFSERSFAAAGELLKAGKGLLKVAGQHKGTIGEGLASGAVMAGAGYGINKAIQSDEESGKKSGLNKTLAVAGTGLLGAMALKKGANWGAFGKASKYVKRGADAAKTGIAFGAGMAAVPEVIKRQQQSKMQEDTGTGTGETTKKSGMSTGTKLLLGAGLALGAAKGGHMLAKSGKLGFNQAQKNATKKVAEGISGKINTAKDSLLRNTGLTGLADKRNAYNAAQQAKADADKLATVTDKRKGEGVLSTITGFMGGGSEKTQRLAGQLQATDSKILKGAGDFMKEHRRTALLAAAPLGYAATWETWQKGEDITNKGLKKLDPEAFKNQEQ